MGFEDNKFEVGTSKLQNAISQINCDSGENDRQSQSMITVPENAKNPENLNLDAQGDTLMSNSNE